MNPWKNPMMDFWLKSVSRSGPSSGVFFNSFFGWPEPGGQTGADNPWQTSMKMAQTMYECFAGFWGGRQEESPKSADLSHMLVSLMQAGLEGYVDLQEQWMEGMKGVARSAGSGDGEDFMKMSSAWIEGCQRLFKPFLNMPTVGLTRAYQEQTNEVIEKYYVFTGHMTELLYQLNIPMDEATRCVKSQMKDPSKTDGTRDTRGPYESWLKILEDKYMELFQSPAYLQLLYKTVDSYSDFLVAQQQVYGNSLRNLPIPTTKDLDELSREIYLLKKKLREMARKMDRELHPNDSGNGSADPFADEEDGSSSNCN